MKRALIALAMTPALMGASCDGPDASVPTAPPKIARTMLRDVTPKSLRTCAPRPDGSAATSNADAAEFVVALDQAGEDCRRKVKALSGLIENEAE